MGKTNAYYLECIKKNKHYRLIEDENGDFSYDNMGLQYGAGGPFVFQQFNGFNWMNIYMAEINEFPGCCGVGTISYFNSREYSKQSEKNFTPKAAILDEKLALQCEYGFMDYKYLMYATRNDRDYAPIIRSLKRLGFEEIVSYKKSISMRSPIILLGCLRA